MGLFQAEVSLQLDDDHYEYLNYQQQKLKPGQEGVVLKSNIYGVMVACSDARVTRKQSFARVILRN